MLLTREWANYFGFASLVLSVGFWVYVHTARDLPSPSNIIGLVATLVAAFLAALVAAICGSKWWLFALLSPLCGVMFVLPQRG